MGLNQIVVHIRVAFELPFQRLDFFRCVDPCWKSQSNGVLCINGCCLQLSHGISTLIIDFEHARTVPVFHGSVLSSDVDGTAILKPPCTI